MRPAIATSAKAFVIVPVTALLLAFEGTAAACPFCGGLDGDVESLVNTLMVVAMFVFGARALMRGLRRVRPAASESDPSRPPRPQS